MKFSPNLASNLPPRQPEPSSENTKTTSATNPHPRRGSRTDRAHSPGSQSLKNLSTSAQRKGNPVNRTNPGSRGTQKPNRRRCARTCGEGLDHAGAARAVVAEDLIRGAHGVRSRTGAAAFHPVAEAGQWRRLGSGSQTGDRGGVARRGEASRRWWERGWDGQALRGGRGEGVCALIFFARIWARFIII
jgi:hypothetical protein